MFCRLRKAGRLPPFPCRSPRQDRQMRVDPPETCRAFERGTCIEAVAQVNEQGTREQTVGPREKPRLVEQDEVVHAAESVRGSLAARWLSLRFFGRCPVHRE